MRKVIAAGIIFICSIHSVQAQQKEPDHRFAVGLKGGSSLSFISRTNGQYSLEGAFYSSLVQGVTGGLSMQYFTDPHFALQVEVLYTQKGWQQIYYDATTGRQTSDLFETTLNYAEIPIQAHGYIGNKNVRIYLDGGIYIGYLFDYTNRQVGSQDPNYLISDSNANRIDLGIKAGAGFEIATKVGTFQLGGSYAWGINGVIKKYQTTPANEANGVPNLLQNNSINITLGYFIEFGKSKSEEQEKESK